MTIVELFSSPVVADVLAIFIIHPAEELSQASIVRQSKHALMQVQRTLNRLEKTNLITKTYRGRYVSYRANRTHPAFEDLKSILFKTAIFGDHLKKSNLAFAFIYGSTACAEEKIDSDIDVCLIGDLSMHDLGELLGPIQRGLDREINAITYTFQELQKKVLENNSFISQILSLPKIWLVGKEDEFRKMAFGQEITKAQNFSARNYQPIPGRRSRSFRRRTSTIIR